MNIYGIFILPKSQLWGGGPQPVALAKGCGGGAGTISAGCIATAPPSRLRRAASPRCAQGGF